MTLPTTLFIDNQDLEYTKYDACHGGEGPFLLKGIIDKAKTKQFVKFMHDDVLLPGSAFGVHQHSNEGPMEEWYICLEGEGVMTNDGKDYAMKPGDVSVCYADGKHGVKNTGKANMRVLVIGVKPADAK